MTFDKIKKRALRSCLLFAGMGMLSIGSTGLQAQNLHRDTAALLKEVGEVRLPSQAELTAAGNKGASLILPTSPEGYHLVFKGSDHLPVITQQGRVYAPIAQTTVCLYYQLMDDKDSSFALDLSKTVVVPPAAEIAQKVQSGIAFNQTAPFVIPALKAWKGGQGFYLLSARSKIVLPISEKETLSPLASQLQEEIEQTTGLRPAIKIGNPGNSDIYLELNGTQPRLGEEGYQLEVTDVLKITAPAYKGLFWGTRTLLQLLEQHKEIPQGLAVDYPTYKVRGLVLDVGRKFFSMDFLRKYVKMLSYYKMNDLQVHLNDNGFKKYFGENWDSTYAAFRLENDTYPGLTSKDGHYSKQEFRDLQALGRQYGVLIVPEIDVPAHALALTHAVPAIGSKKYGMDHLDLHNPLTDTVVHNILKEYLEGENPVFTGPVVDIGTDEYAKAEAEAFRGFTDRVIGWVQDYGKQVRLWGALTWAQGNTPVRVKGVTMNTWYNGYAEPREMKKLGYPQISTPDGWLYIVPAAGYYYDYLNLSHLYDHWTPAQVGSVRFEPGDTGIIGGAFAVWNDIVGNGITEQDVTDRVFPALQVLSQKMWGGEQKAMDFKSFDNQRLYITEGPGLNLSGRMGTYQNGKGLDVPIKKDWLGDISSKGIKGVFKEKLSSQDRKVSVLTGTALKNSWVFKNPKDKIILSQEEIGYDYTISFYLYRLADAQKTGKVQSETIFSSAHASVVLNQKGTGQLGFSREGYDLSFNYTVPTNKWVHIVVTGTNKGTALFVDGKATDSLYNHFIQYDDKDKTKMRKIETLVFPLRQLGGFNGKITGLTIYNKALAAGEIEALK